MTTTDALRATSGVGAAQPVETTPADDPGDAALLPEPAPLSLGTDSMTALAQLLTRADSQDRTAARAAEDAADGAAMKDESQRVSQMNDKANQDAAQGIATGLGDIVGGGLTAAGGLLPDGSRTGGADSTASGGATSWRLVAEGAGRASPGVGAIFAGANRAQADRDDASAAMFEAQAQMAIRRHDAERDAAQAASDSIGKVQDLLQSMQQTTNDSRSSAASALRGG